MQSIENTIPIGRRDRKRLETKTALYRAALRLFSKHGFDDVTVVEIAELADVNPSTFFRHFGSKEALVFEDYNGYTLKFVDLLSNRPASETPLKALLAAWYDLIEEDIFDTDFESLRTQLVESSPTLRIKFLAYREELIQKLAAALAHRSGVDPATDAAPNLAAATWVLVVDWFIHRREMTPTKTKTVGLLTDDVCHFLELRKSIFDF